MPVGQLTSLSLHNVPLYFRERLCLIFIASLQLFLVSIFMVHLFSSFTITFKVGVFREYLFLKFILAVSVS